MRIFSGVGGTWSGCLLLIAAASNHVQSQTVPQRLYDVVYHHAPFIIAETRDNEPLPESIDHLLPIDFDGDLIGANNASHAQSQVVVDGRPTVYFSIIESGSTSDQGYFFIGYYFYHPRDGGQTFAPIGGGPQVNRPGHEHDLEGAYFIVKKSPYDPYGEVVGALAEAHGALIPYPNLASSDYPAIQPYDWWGSVFMWPEPVTGLYRSVVGIRAQTHGTYMAQNCNPAYWVPDDYFGMWAEGVDQFGTPFVSCIHTGTHAIIYKPSYDGSGVARLGPYVRSGQAAYRLADLHESPIWQQRLSTDLFQGSVTTISDGGDQAYTFFRTSNGSNDANPPWAWRGGAGECPDYQAVVACWHSFGIDNTGGWNDRIFWYQAVQDGNLLTRPEFEMAQRFHGLPNLFLPITFNQYWMAPPPPPPPPYAVYVEGPEEVSSLATWTWTAYPDGGVSPYTYDWETSSGSFSGTSATFWASFPQLGYSYTEALYLVVRDATDAPVYVVKYVTVD